MLRSSGRLVLCGRPERLARALAPGPWRTVDAWPVTRTSRRGTGRGARAAEEQVVCLERVADEPRAVVQEPAGERKSEDWARCHRP